jgi:hypothetical protein
MRARVRSRCQGYLLFRRAIARGEPSATGTSTEFARALERRVRMPRRRRGMTTDPIEGVALFE